MLIAFQAEKTDSVPTGLPRWHSNKEALANIGDTRDVGSLPGSGRSLGVGNGNPLQYSCLGNPIDRETRQAHGARVGHNSATDHAPLLSGLRSYEFKSENSGDGWSKAENDWLTGGGTLMIHFTPLSFLLGP